MWVSYPNLKTRILINPFCALINSKSTNKKIDTNLYNNVQNVQNLPTIYGMFNIFSIPDILSFLT